MQVALERGTQRRRLLVQLHPGGGPHTPQIRWNLTGESFVDHQCGDLADAREVAEPARAGQPPELVLRQVGDDRRGPAEGTHAITGLSGALQQEGDLAQGINRIHALILTQTDDNRQAVRIERVREPPIGCSADESRS